MEWLEWLEWLEWYHCVAYFVPMLFVLVCFTITIRMQESMSIGDLIAGILASVIPIFNIIVAVAFIADLLNRVEFTVFDTVIWRKKHVSQQ